ncbi:hypothetical protein OH77DRAFT_138881 [Trametes cingulata]|nr:hypothetical protein OH77DRAFT_138881 [Trametes cingulata]
MGKPLWFGVEHCTTLSTGVRIAIGIASVAAFIFALLILRHMRTRADRRTNLMYVGTGPTGNGAPSAGQVPPSYPTWTPQGHYNQNQQYPQYPPSSYNPYASPEGSIPSNLPQYAPPPGPPPAQEGYAPPPGPPPAQGGYAPPAGPPPGQGEPPQYYAPPPGPPPATDWQK